jgi:hypothetical protein
MPGFINGATCGLCARAMSAGLTKREVTILV